MKKPGLRPSSTIFWLILVLGLAAGVRSAHLDRGLPDLEGGALPSKIAIGMWGFDDGTPDFDPGTAGWPALSFYVQRAVQQLHYFGGRLTGRFADPLDYYVAWLVDPSAVILLGRVTSVLCGLIVCFVAFRMGLQLGGVPAAVFAGALCAVSPLLVRQSQRVEPDALVMAFSALALLWFLRVARDGRPADYAVAGLWIGLGAASKYTPALMASSLYIVHLERRRAEGLSIRYLGFNDRRLGWAALVALLGFCVATPYTLANLAVLRRDLGYQALHMSSGHFGHAQHGNGYIYYLFDVLPDALGWPALVAGLAGLILALRGSAMQRVALWGLLPYLIVFGAMSTHFDRYILPAVLPLALGGAVLLHWIRKRSGERIWPVAVLTGLILILPGLGTLRQERILAAPGTQALSAEWLTENMDAEHEFLVSERYGPTLPRDQRGILQSDPAFARMSPEQQQRLIDRPFYRVLDIPMYSVRSELAAYYYDLRFFLSYDWLVVSGSVRNRYLADPERFGRQARFYEMLDEIAEPIWSVRSRGRIRGPSQQVYRIDDAFRRAVLDRLGPLSPDHYLPYLGELHLPHFVGFVQTIAAHAELREDRVQAAFWYLILIRTAEDPAKRILGLERAGINYLELGRFGEAREMFRDLAGFPGLALVALGNLGLVAERSGDAETARSFYQQVIRRDPGGDAGAWARQRLAALDGGGP